MSTQHTGASGEFFVAAELSRRGWAVGLTRAGMKNTDILAEHTETGRMVVIQVKTSNSDSFTLHRKNEEPAGADNHWFVFVRLPDLIEQPLRQPEYFLVPHDVVAQICFYEHKVWLDVDKTAKNGKQHQDSTMRNIYKRNLLDKQRDWDRLLAPMPEFQGELSKHYQELFDRARKHGFTWPSSAAL